MQSHNYTEFSQVQEHYTIRHLKMVKSLGVKPLIWHDPLEFGVKVWNASSCELHVLTSL